jgi:hypothetical protein
VLRPGGRIVVAYIALTRPFTEFGPALRAHLERVAEFFAEHPRDIPTSSALRALFQRHDLPVADSMDLTDGVFPPRHENFVSMLRWLRHTNSLVRAGARTFATRRWKVRPAEFTDFLLANTAAHPCRFYEYHLMTCIKEPIERSSVSDPDHPAGP